MRNFKTISVLMNHPKSTFGSRQLPNFSADVQWEERFFRIKLVLYQNVLTKRCRCICSKIQRLNVAMLLFFYFWKHLVKFQGKSVTNTHEPIIKLYVSHNLNIQNPQQDHHTSICYEDFTRKNIFASIGIISCFLVWAFNFLPRSVLSVT